MTAIAMVVHVLPLDIARGAQVFARGLCDELGPEHRLLTLFAGEPVVLRADVRLDVPPGRLRGAGFDPRVALRLRRELRGLGPRVVVAHGGEALQYAALVRPRGAALVYLKIGLTAGLLHGRLRLAFLRRVAGRADAVVGVSEEMVEEARDLLRIPAGRALLIHNGRDPARYVPGPAGDPPRLIFVGQLGRAKRPDLFCHVVREVRARGTTVDGLVVGEGPLLGELPSEDVELLGRRDDVPALLAGSDVLVFTGERSEGMPGVLIEAGLCGLPVVTTDVPGARAVVEDGGTGHVVGPDDRGGLVDRVERLAGDAELRRTMGVAARERCLERFTMEASADRWQRLLDALPRGSAPEGAIHEALRVQ